LTKKTTTKKKVKRTTPETIQITKQPNINLIEGKKKTKKKKQNAKRKINLKKFK
jgi:hypothetical protein